MHARTAATLEKLYQAQWFRYVGIRDTEVAEVLNSWKEAIKSCRSLAWENLCLEAANGYCEKLARQSPERFEKWNDIVDEIKPVTQALVREKTEEVVEANELPEIFLNCVDWDILHLCMEAEYADVCPPGFFAGQAYWYVSGHFPCGWRGPIPDGKLIIY
jgi:hypothetical protein